MAEEAARSAPCCALTASLTAHLCFPGNPAGFVGLPNTSTVLSPPSEPPRPLLLDAEKEVGLRIWSDADVAHAEAQESVIHCSTLRTGHIFLFHVIRAPAKVKQGTG